MARDLRHLPAAGAAPYRPAAAHRRRSSTPAGSPARPRLPAPPPTAAGCCSADGSEAEAHGRGVRRPLQLADARRVVTGVAGRRVGGARGVRHRRRGPASAARRHRRAHRLRNPDRRAASRFGRPRLDAHVVGVAARCAPSSAAGTADAPAVAGVEPRAGVTDGETGEPAVHALKGLVRVLAYEHPDLRTAMVDLDSDGDAVATLIGELGVPARDDDRGLARQPAVRRATGAGRRGRLAAAPHRARRRRLHRHRGPRRSRPGDRSLAGRPRRGPCGAQRPLRAVDRTEAGDRRARRAHRHRRRLRRHRHRGCRRAPRRRGGGLRHDAARRDPRRGRDRRPDHGRPELGDAWSGCGRRRRSAPLRLHEATADRELDWWVGFSSIASLLGAPGQGAYAAASAWLDGLVAWRRASGLPATTINWGQWSDVGVAQSLTFSVLDPITPAEGIEALEACSAATTPASGSLGCGWIGPLRRSRRSRRSGTSPSWRGARRRDRRRLARRRGPACARRHRGAPRRRRTPAVPGSSPSWATPRAAASTAASR